MQITDEVRQNYQEARDKAVALAVVDKLDLPQKTKDEVKAKLGNKGGKP